MHSLNGKPPCSDNYTPLAINMLPSQEQATAHDWCPCRLFSPKSSPWQPTCAGLWVTPPLGSTQKAVGTRRKEEGKKGTNRGKTWNRQLRKTGRIVTKGKDSVIKMSRPIVWNACPERQYVNHYFRQREQKWNKVKGSFNCLIWRTMIK